MDERNNASAALTASAGHLVQELAIAQVDPCHRALPCDAVPAGPGVRSRSHRRGRSAG